MPVFYESLSVINQQNDDIHRNYDPDAPYKHCGASKHHIDRQKRPIAIGYDHPLPQSGRPCAAQSRFGLFKIEGRLVSWGLFGK